MSHLRCPNPECKSLYMHTDPGMRGFHVVCTVCGVRGPIALTKPLAEERWNALTRDPHSSLPASVTDMVASALRELASTSSPDLNQIHFTLEYVLEQSWLKNSDLVFGVDTDHHRAGIRLLRQALKEVEE